MFAFAGSMHITTCYAAIMLYPEKKNSSPFPVIFFPLLSGAEITKSLFLKASAPVTSKCSPMRQTEVTCESRKSLDATANLRPRRCLLWTHWPSVRRTCKVLLCDLHVCENSSLGQVACVCRCFCLS